MIILHLNNSSHAFVSVMPSNQPAQMVWSRPRGWNSAPRERGILTTSVPLNIPPPTPETAAETRSYEVVLAIINAKDSE